MTFQRRLFLLASLSLVSCVGDVVRARADSLEDAKALIVSGDVDAGRKMLNEIAESGDAATQYAVGTELLNLDGDDGYRWITAAAERGYANAQRDLGLMYASGVGVKQDLPHAFMWYALSLMGNLDPSLQEDAKKNTRSAYNAMTPRERKEAERLIANWKSK